MAPRLQCPRCGARKSWLLKNGRRRCARCRHDWRPGRLPLRLSPQEWRAILRWFVRGAPSAAVARETRLDRKRVLRALTIVRRAVLRAAPVTFRRAIGLTHAPVPRVAEHQRAAPRKAATPPRSRFATLGLYAVRGHAWAEVVTDAEAEQIGRLLRERHGRQSINRLRLPRYMAVVYRGRLYRLVESGSDRAPFGPLEAFWAYLQRQLRATGGIRRERLGLYLAAFAWRYNHRIVPPPEQVQELLELIRQPR